MSKPKIPPRNDREPEKRDGLTAATAGVYLGSPVFMNGLKQVYRSLLDDLSEAMAVIDLDGRIVYCNRCFAELITTPVDQTQGTQLGDWLEPPDQEALVAMLPEIDGQSRKIKVGLKQPEGTRLPVIFKLSKLDIVEKQELIGILMTQPDRDNIQDNGLPEPFDLVIFQQAPGAIIACSADGIILQANQRAFSLFPNLVIGEYFDRCLHLQLPNDQRFSLASQIEIGTCDNFEVKVDGPDQIRHFLVSLGTLTPGSLADPGWVINFADISLRVAVEKMLQESEDCYRDLFEHSQELICLHDLQGKILLTNKWVQQVLGYRPDEITNRSIGEILSPEVRHNFDEYLDEIKNKGVFQGITIVKTITGENRILRFRNTLRVSGVPKPVVRVIAHDITDLWKTENALKEKTSDLGERVKELNCLVKISQLPQQGQLTIGEILQETANLLPTAFRYPEVTCARIKLGEHIYASANYAEGVSRVCADIVNRDGNVGLVEVILLEDTPEGVVSGFLPEENELVETATKILSQVLQRMQVEIELRSSNERYKSLYDANPYPMFIYDLETLCFLDVNDAACRHLGYSRQEFMHMTLEDIHPPEEIPRLLKNISQVSQGLDQAGIWKQRKKNGEIVLVEVTSHTLEWQGCRTEVVLALDVTERLRAERELQKSEERYRRLAENAVDLIYRYEFYPHRGFSYISPAATEMTGYTPEEHYQDPDLGFKLIHPDDHHLLHNPDRISSEPLILRWVRKDGSILWTEQRNVAIYNDEQDLIAIEGIARDISARIQAEQQLRLLAVGMDAAANAIVITDREGTIEWVNPAFCGLTGFDIQECIGRNPRDLIKSGQHDQPFYQQMWETVLSGQVWKGEMVNRRKGGSLYSEEMTITPVIDQANAISHFVAIKQDVTERLQNEKALRDSEARFRVALANSPILVFNQDQQLRYTWIYNPHPAFTLDEMLGKTDSELLPGEPGERLTEIKRAVLESGITTRNEIDLYINGHLVFYDLTVEPLRDRLGNIIGVTCAAVDITERKQHQREMEAIALLSQALRRSQTSAGMLPLILDHVQTSLDVESTALVLCAYEQGVATSEEARGEFAEVLREKLPPGEGVSGIVIASGKTFVTSDIRSETSVARRQDFKIVRAVACVPLTVPDQNIGALWAGRQAEFSEAEVRLLGSIADIAANAIRRASLYEQSQQHLQRLAALHTIDLAINSNHDLHQILDVIVRQCVTQLEVSAADILLLNPQSIVLEFVAGFGFRTKGIEKSKVRLGKGISGSAALDKRKAFIPDLKIAANEFSRSPLIAGESFISYLLIPLTVKNEIQGVLELFYRSRLDIDDLEQESLSDWQQFVDTLATQTAIAIDTAQLYEGLQRSNIDLKLAYEDTIEGWACAMDLRDEATEGHTRRVTEMVLQLARLIGVNEAQIVHIRRGALLHDIGKMGIPDAILFKPGKLSDEEWEIVIQHPVNAHKMLAPIDYLSQSLDIPYCHHEKWDGSGYPRGLKGEQIPLAARIFAVVDVWDALCSDRPYRPAWTEEAALEYIRSNSGSHFDPKVVEVFLKLLADSST